VSIADHFARCEINQQDRTRKKRINSFREVMRADGVRPIFSARARQALLVDVKAMIMDANWMDAELHALAVELLQQRKQAAEATGPLPVCRPMCGHCRA
jgi:hypothetical protein